MPVSKKIYCLAVDDEPPALDVLKKYISAVPSLELVAICNNAVEALTILQQQNIDLIFLDIQMPELLGTDMLRTIKRPPKVIFTTAYRKFAIEGFELDAVDYLLKPISFERFLKAVNKVMETSLQTTTTIVPEVKPSSLEGSISLRADRKNLKIPIAEILYIESLKDYIKVVTATRTIVTKQPISSIEEMLPKDHFLRIHRSYIVALHKIETYTTELIGIGKQEFPISRMYRLEVGKVLKTN
jgi:DNA-binding LytR/AlgR family response regulator